MSIPLSVLRILDAAANRAGEGLRVVEEYTRFALNDAHLSQVLKKARHDLAQALETIPPSHRLASRDTLGDVGTAITTSTEYQRTSPLDVAQASLKRVQEALRTLEEFGKLLETTFAPRIEQIRYRLYTIEKAVVRTTSAIDRLRGQFLYLLVTSELCAKGLEATVHGALAAGVRLFQLREKQMPDRDLVSIARRLREWTARENALLIINDRPDIAALCDADGVHVGQEELSVQDARQIVGPDRLIGVSTHTIQQARHAVLEGADYIGVGPTFPSKTKSFDAFAGLEFVRQVADEIALPWFAIGGIAFENLQAVLNAGATRVAVSSVICRSQEPQVAAMQMLSRLSATAALES